MTNEQIARIYSIKMQNLMNKNARREQEQDDADRAAFQKKQKLYGDISAGLSIAGMGKDLYEWRQGKLLDIKYKEDENILGGLKSFKKYKPKEDRSFKEVIGDIGTGENIKRLTPKGSLEETEGYKEFKASEISLTEEMIEVDDLPSPAPQPDYAKIQGAAEDQKLQALRELETTPGITPEVSADPKLEKALGGLEKLKAPKVKGSDEVLPEQLRASAGMSDMPDVEAPDAKPGGKYVGKALEALQTLKTMQGIGETLTSEEASGADKAIAGTQATKMLADMAAKRAGQETASQIGSKAATQFIKGKGLQEGVKLGGKQAVGAVAGGAIGAYTAVTEAKETGESWKEKDYDEAILHGMGSASGVLQTAGTGMMLTGVGSPIGAVLYGIGTAGSAISSAGLMLEGLFGGGGEPDKPKKPKFNAAKYLQSIRGQRSYGR